MKHKVNSSRCIGCLNCGCDRNGKQNKYGQCVETTADPEVCPAEAIEKEE